MTTKSLVTNKAEILSTSSNLQAKEILYNIYVNSFSCQLITCGRLYETE